MAGFSLKNDEVVGAVLIVMGVGRTVGKMDASTESDVRQIIRSGLRKFLYPLIGDRVHQWSFLSKYHPISVDAVFDDGTLTIIGGTATLAGGTWPDDIVDYFIDTGDNVLYVTSRTDANNVEISHTNLTAAALTTYTAYRFRYDLPADFAEFQGGLVYQSGSDHWLLSGSSESELRLRYAVGQGLSSRTTHYAITSAPDADAESAESPALPAQQIIFWPVPEPDAFIQGLYLIAPDDKLPADLTTPGVVVQVPPLYSEAALESILSAAEEYNDDTQGVHAVKFQSSLAAAILHDKASGAEYDFSRRVGEGIFVPEATSIEFNWTGF